MVNLFTKKNIKEAHYGIIFAITAMIALVVLPIPPLFLDFIFTFNIALSLVILLVCIYILRPLDLSVFPTILLLTTLLRLTLNVASTRVVLLNGHLGTGAAGKVIKAFGEILIGGNFVVGIIVFSILMIINFVVVTKGAGRISEVSARFILDAMPGKQMAIDADLNAGVLNQEEAKRRRQEVMQEADFYGSMDGASKFIRGDAIAGILILFINLLGGIIIGTTQFQMPLNVAVQNFSLLTIGDGLVAQIPSLLLSIAAAIMVTRVNNEADMTKQTISQLFSNPKPLFITATILLLLAIVPNMPHIPFISLAALTFYIGYHITNKKHLLAAQPMPIPSKIKNLASPNVENELDWKDIVSSDYITLEIGYGLIGLVGVNRDGLLINRIKAIRRKLSHELGFLIPEIHVKDNMSSPLNLYKIFLKNVVIAQDEIHIDKLLAINPGHVTEILPGVACKDPTFSMDAYWIAHHSKARAQELGYTVVDPNSVLATHLNQVTKRNAYQLLGYDEVQQLLTRLSATAPKLVENFTSTATGLPLHIIVTVLQRLLQSDIPILDMRTIAEKMIESWSKNKDIDCLIENVRISLKKLIIYSLCPNKKEIDVGVLDNQLAQILHESIQQTPMPGEKIMMIEPSLSEKIYTHFLEFVQKCEIQSVPAIMMVASELRGLLEKLFKSSIPSIHFLSFNEIPDDHQLNIIAKIG